MSRDRQVALDSGKCRLADNSTQPESAAKSHNSADQEKKAEGPGKKIVEPEKKDAGKTDQSKRASAEDTVGEPLAAGMMQLLRNEIVNGLSHAATPIVSPTSRARRSDR